MLVANVRQLVSQVSTSRLSFVPRTANGVAHSIAKYLACFEGCFSWLGDMSSLAYGCY